MQHMQLQRARNSLAAVTLALLTAAGCDDGSDTIAEPDRYSITISESTFVDDSRATPATGEFPALASRTLEALVYVPEGRGPFPLLIFSHGLGATPQLYAALTEEVAAAGFVIVAPYFPLTSQNAPAGPDPADTQQQPGDVSFLIDAVAAAAARPPFSGRVDTQRVGTFGHSNGAITTLGIVANSCCKDGRIDAAVSLAGTASPFNGGAYDFGNTPPLMLVHGTDDVLVPYDGSVQVFNNVEAAKGMLTLDGLDHGSFITASGNGFTTTANTIVDFFRTHLKGNAEAEARLVMEQVYDTDAQLRYSANEGTAVTLPLPPPITNRVAAVAPSTGLMDGQIVTVTWRNFIVGRVVNIVQCAAGGTGGNEVCDFTNAYVLHPNPTGEGSLPFTVVEGAVGSGRCDAQNNDCVIVVNDSSLVTEDAIIRVPISFAP